MRTTVTLDDDVAAALTATARERGVSFKEALNTAVRSGLSGTRTGASGFVARAFDLGIRPGVNIDKANQLAADLEDEAILAKLDLRK
jgi:hypothetical protein